MSQNHAVEEGNVYIQQLTVAFPVGKGDIIEYSYSLQLLIRICSLYEINFSAIVMSSSLSAQGP